MRSERKPREPRAPRPPRTQVMATVGGAHSKETAAYMRSKKATSRYKAQTDQEQMDAYDILCEFGPKPGRTAVHGWTVFDFWWHDKGVALELDTPGRDARHGETIDRYYFARSGILVYRADISDKLRIRETAEAVGAMEDLADRKPDVALYKDAARAYGEWEKIRCILDPRRKDTWQPPMKTQR